MKRLYHRVRVALRDLRGDLRSFVVLIACLALGTGTIAAVGGVGAGLNAAIAGNATTLLGGDMEVYRPTKEADLEERALIDSLGTVVQVMEGNGRGVAGENSTFLDIVAVDDAYPLLGMVVSPQLAAGEKPAGLLAPRDGVFGAIVDPLLLERLGIAIGDTFRIGKTDFQVRGTLGGLPEGPIRGFHLGVTTLISTAGLQPIKGQVSQPLPGLETRYSYKVLLGERPYDDAANAVLAALNPNVWSVRDPREAIGRLVRYYDLFTRFLLIVGLSSLLVGGVGISTVVTAYLGEQQRAIATLRSLGANEGRVYTHYFVQILAVVGIGVGIGVALGAASSALALPLLGSVLSISVPPTLDVPSLLTAAAFGLLAGIAFSSIALARAGLVSPALLFRSAGATLPSLRLRDAMRPKVFLPLGLAAIGAYALAVITTKDVSLVNAFFVGALAAYFVFQVGGYILKRVLAASPSRRPSAMRYALRNMRVEGSTAPVVILSVGLSLAMLLVVALFDANLNKQLRGVVPEDAASFVGYEMFEDEVDLIRQMSETDPEIRGIEAGPSYRSRITLVAGRNPGELRDISDETGSLLASDIAVTWRADQPAGGTITAGEWWPADYSGPPLISLHDAIRTDLGLKVGDVIEFTMFEEKIEATIANFRDYPFQGGLNFMVTFPPGVLEVFPSTFLGEIKVAPGADQSVERKLTEALPDIMFVPVGEALRQAAGALGQLATGVNVLAGVGVLNGLLVLAGTMAAGRKRREQDAVLHKVLGASRRDVLSIFVLEYGLLAAYAALIAVLIGLIGGWLIIRSTLQVSFDPSPALILLIALGGAIATLASGALTTWRSLSKSPAAVLRQA